MSTSKMPTSPIRVLVVDDQLLFREGVVSLLSTMPEVVVVGEATHGEEAVALAGKLAPDVVLMDLRMPVLDGVEATRRICAGSRHTRVVVLTTFDDDDSILDAVHAGALGYLLKDAGASALLDALCRAARGESVLTPRVATRLVHHVARGSRPAPAGATELTSREREVLILLARGRSNKEIAQALRVVEGTIKNHLTSTFAKLGVTTRLEAAMVARDMGLVTGTPDHEHDDR